MTSSFPRANLVSHVGDLIDAALHCQPGVECNALVIGALASLCSQSALTLYYTACATAVGGKMTCFKTSPAESVKDGVDMVLVTCQSREDCSQRDLSLRVGSNVIRLQRQMCVTSALRSTPG